MDGKIITCHRHSPSPRGKRLPRRPKLQEVMGADPAVCLPATPERSSWNPHLNNHGYSVSIEWSEPYSQSSPLPFAYDWAMPPASRLLVPLIASSHPAESLFPSFYCLVVRCTLWIAEDDDIQYDGNNKCFSPSEIERTRSPASWVGKRRQLSTFKYARCVIRILANEKNRKPFREYDIIHRLLWHCAPAQETSS